MALSQRAPHWVLVTLALLFLVSPPASAQFHRAGIVTSIFDANHRAAVDDLGAGSIRLNFFWSDLETSNNVFQWSPFDTWLSEASARNLHVLVSLSSTPQWAGPAWTGDCAYGRCAPYNFADWYDFVYRVLERYGHYDNVTWGVWNEPNLHFLNDDPYATVYTVLYREANLARQAIRPSARLAGPETSHHAFTHDNYFSNAMNGIAPHMASQDVVTVHWYPDGPYHLHNYMQNIRSIVWSTAGPRDLWLSETGSIGTCSDATQDSQIDYILENFSSSGLKKS